MKKRETDPSAADWRTSGETRVRLQAVPQDATELPGLSPSHFFGGELTLRVHSVKMEPGTQGASASIEVNVSMLATDALVAEIDQSFDPWTSTQEEAEAYGGITSPEFGAWAAATLIENDRARIEADGVMLLEAIDSLMSFRLRPPAWLAAAYRRRLNPFQTFKVRTLDEAFGIEAMTERKRRAEQFRHEKFIEVHRALVDAIRADPQQAVDNGLFETVGRAFGIGKTVCREVYDFAVQEHGLQDLVELKKLIAFSAQSPPGR